MGHSASCEAALFLGSDGCAAKRSARHNDRCRLLRADPHHSLPRSTSWPSLPRHVVLEGRHDRNACSEEHTIRVQTLGGAEVAALHLRRPGTVRQLKEALRQHCSVASQRLVHASQGILADDYAVSLLPNPAELQLVRLPFDKQMGACLLSAAVDGHSDAAADALQGLADPDVARSADGATALILACQHGHAEVVRLLAEAGADTELPKFDGRTPLSVAAQGGHLEVVRCLCDLGVDLDKPQRTGATPLHAAACGGHADVVRFLCSRKADRCRLDNDGWTPALLAAYMRHSDVVRILEEHGELC